MKCEGKRGVCWSVNSRESNIENDIIDSLICLPKLKF